MMLNTVAVFVHGVVEFQTMNHRFIKNIYSI